MDNSDNMVSSVHTSILLVYLGFQQTLGEKIPSHTFSLTTFRFPWLICEKKLELPDSVQILYSQYLTD